MMHTFHCDVVEGFEKQQALVAAARDQDVQLKMNVPDHPRWVVVKNHVTHHDLVAFVLRRDYHTQKRRTDEMPHNWK